MSEARHLEEHPAQDLSQAPLEPWVRGELPSPPRSPEWKHHFKKRVHFTDIYRGCSKEIRLLDQMREHETGESSPMDAPASQAAAKSGQEWLIAQFQELLQQMQQRLATGVPDSAPTSAATNKPAPKTRIRPVRTPRSDAPLAEAKPAEMLRPEFSKRRLYFSCPCCRFPAVLPKWLAGKKARCPRCYSALRAPHPSKGLTTRVLENDVESVLHPERFAEYYRAHQLIPWLGIPMPRFNPAFHASGMVVLLVLLAFWIPSLIDRAHRPVPVAALATPHADKVRAPGYKERARNLIEQFLAAENVEAKSVFVRDPARVAPLMSDWYRRRGGGSPVTARAIEVSGTGYYSGGETSHPVSDVHVELPGGETAAFTVEHLPEGDCIEWETSVGYSTSFPTILERGPGASPQPVRVMAALDDYYNFSYTDPDSHLCIRLHDPATMELLGFGYVPVTDELVPALVDALAGSNKGDLRPLMLEVQAAENARRSRQVTITRMIQSGWRTGYTLAKAGASR
jgi:hypothetical protein